MTHDFVNNILRDNWFQTAKPGSVRTWTFKSDVDALSEVQLETLVEIYCDCVNAPRPSAPELRRIIETLVADRECQNRGVVFSRMVLAKLLHALTVAEYRINDIVLLPPELRDRELQATADSIGIDRETLLLILDNWSTKVRG